MASAPIVSATTSEQRPLKQGLCLPPRLSENRGTRTIGAMRLDTPPSARTITRASAPIAATRLSTTWLVFGAPVLKPSSTTHTHQRTIYRAAPRTRPALSTGHSTAADRPEQDGPIQPTPEPRPRRPSAEATQQYYLQPRDVRPDRLLVADFPGGGRGWNRCRQTRFRHCLVACDETFE